MNSVLALFASTALGVALVAAQDTPKPDAMPASATPAKPSAGPTLKIGDPAPPLKVAKWFKGTPTGKFETGQIYVVEFWATWCGPCLKSVPHLTELAKQFDGKAQIIGVSIWESEKKDHDKRLAAVGAFVTRLGDKMDYNVAADDNEGSMAKNWMEAAGQSGIPTAFIVGKDGNIAWIGYPWAGLDQALEQSIADTLDIKTVQAAAAKQQQEKATKELHYAPLKPINELKQQHKPAEAIAALDQLIAGHPEYANETGFLRYKLLMEYDQPAAYIEVRKLLTGELKDNPNALYSIGRDLTDPPGPKVKNWDLAFDVCQRAATLSPENPSNLAILAEAYAGKHDYAKAVETMEQALAKAATEDGYPAGSTNYLKARLKGFKQSMEKTSPPKP